MKRCPSCGFTFADFHRVCDFDGAELVEEPQRQPSPAKAPSRFWRVLKSEMFVAAAGLLFVLVSALLVGYYDATNQLKPIAGDQTPPEAPASPITPAQDSTASIDQAWAENKTPSASIRAADERNPIVARNSKRSKQPSFAARPHPGIARASTITSRHSTGTTVARDRSPKSTTAERLEANEVREKAAHRKDPKLVAMLKTTWNVLKKPFKF
jgi:hypothetical protein